MKRYLITGASRGIGRAVAVKLATKDAELLLHGRDTVALAQTRKAVERECARVTLLIHDLATARGVSELIAEGRPVANRLTREQCRDCSSETVYRDHVDRMGADHRR